jgi:hypothetical protein
LAEGGARAGEEVLQIQPVRVEEVGRGLARIWDASGAAIEISTASGLIAQQLVSIFGRVADQEKGTKANTAEKALPAEDGSVVMIISSSSTVKERVGWFRLEVKNLDGNCVHLLVMPQATVLQVRKRLLLYIPQSHLLTNALLCR